MNKEHQYYKETLWNLGDIVKAFLIFFFLPVLVMAALGRDIIVYFWYNMKRRTDDEL